MPTKPVFSRLASMINAPAVINGIITQIETAFANTLSRDGSTPNQMQATLDMNSNQIINLPAPSTAGSPVRVVDLNSYILNGTVSHPYVWQVQMALANAGYFYTIEAVLDATPTNQAYITWTRGVFTYTGDSLNTLIVNTLGAPTAATIYTNALALTP